MLEELEEIVYIETRPLVPREHCRGLRIALIDVNIEDHMHGFAGKIPRRRPRSHLLDPQESMPIEVDSDS